jgi:HEPN domain-containing protein/predicted nucleotidyltransferase
MIPDPLIDITRRIVEFYEPDRIILYGSHGKEMADQESDIDLLIIKETEKKPVERRMEVEMMLSDRSVPIDILVYTPGEMRLLYAHGSPFIEEVVETGRLLYMRKATETWIKDAEDELDSSIILLEHGKYRGSCYHSQQCAEKALKAFVIEKGERPERTHDIVELLNRVTSLGWEIDLSMDGAVFLNSIYKGRYPTEEGLLPHGEPSQEDAERALTGAKMLIENLKRLMK